MRIGYFVSGLGRLAKAAIAQQTEIGIESALLLLDHKADRSVEEFGTAHSVPSLRMHPRPSEGFAERLIDACAPHGLDLIVMTYDWIVPECFLERYKHRVINVHPGLLPGFAGMNAIRRCAESGVRFGGATIHEASADVDDGPIIAQCVLGLRLGESAESFGSRLFNDLRLMYLQVLSWYVEGRVEHLPDNRISIRNAAYGDFPISPSVERAFP